MPDTSFDAFLRRVTEVTPIRSQSGLATALGIGRAAVSLAKRKDKVPAKWIMDLADRYSLSREWLATGSGPDPGRGRRGESGADEDSFERVPKVEARLSAGGGSFEAEAAIRGYYAFRSDWIRRKGNPGRMVLMDVVGNSMEPEIREGDTVLVDQSRQDIVAGAVYAVGVEDTVMVKRLEKLPGRLILRSDNPDYAPVALQGDELATVRIIGRVIWSSREFR